MEKVISTMLENIDFDETFSITLAQNVGMSLTDFSGVALCLFSSSMLIYFLSEGLVFTYLFVSLLIGDSYTANIV